MVRKESVEKAVRVPPGAPCKLPILRRFFISPSATIPLRAATVLQPDS